MSQTAPSIPRVPFPAKLSTLFEPAPYKVMYGGRGGGKSWAVARAFLLLGMKKVERFLCLREVQHSIKESVHQLLCDQIDSLDLRGFYRTTDTMIRGSNGTTFNFSGMQEHTIDSVRSFEGATKVWVEEAQAVRKRSWDVLIPTIRTPGREFWITFNPLLESGQVWQRFVVAPPPGAVVMKINWSDNPWFPEELNAERLHAKATMDPEEYLNIWEGEPVRSIPGAIFAKQIAQMYAESRVTIVPYDPRLKVHVVQDLGFTDINAVGWFQRRGSELRCIKTKGYELERNSAVAADIKAMRYNYGAVWLPHDGFAESRKGEPDSMLYLAQGFTVKRVPNVNKEPGIRVLREVFPQLWFHEPDTKDGIEGLKSYKRRSSPQTGEIGAPIHDEASNWGDMFRYAALSAPQFWNEADLYVPPTAPRQVLDPYMGNLG